MYVTKFTKSTSTKQFEPLHKLKDTSPYHSNNQPVVLSLTFSHNSEGKKGGLVFNWIHTMNRFKTNLSSNDQWNLKSLRITERSKDKFSHARKKNKNRDKRSRIFTKERLVLYGREEVIFKQYNNKTTCPKKCVNDTNSC